MAEHKGRKAGVPNKSTAVKRAALAMAGEAVAKAKGLGPIKARKGISPKDMLLDAMRQAWDAAHALNAKAVEKDAEAAVEQDAAKVEAMRKEAVGLRLLAAEQHEIAADLATRVAPYEHAKLQNLDTRIAGNLYVNLRVF